MDNYGRLTSREDTLLKDKKDWMMLCSNYEGLGNEKYLTIGYFNPKIKLHKVAKGHPQFYSTYYYIDDVSLVELNDTNSCDCTYKSRNKVGDVVQFKQDTGVSNLLNRQIGETIVLQNIYFASNSYNLLAESDGALNELYNLLKENPKVTIEIQGHTDNSGNENSNHELSENRAKAVANYLISKGMDKIRITWKGYGNSNPIEDNGTEEGRIKNRRVEFKILSK